MKGTISIIISIFSPGILKGKGFNLGVNTSLGPSLLPESGHDKD